MVCVSVSSPDTEVIDLTTWSDYITLSSLATEKHCDKGAPEAAVSEIMTYLQQHDSWCFSVPSNDRLFIHGPHGLQRPESDMLFALACLLVQVISHVLHEKDLNSILVLVRRSTSFGRNHIKASVTHRHKPQMSLAEKKIALQLWRNGAQSNNLGHSSRNTHITEWRKVWGRQKCKNTNHHQKK